MSQPFIHPSVPSSLHSFNSFPSLFLASIHQFDIDVAVTAPITLPLHLHLRVRVRGLAAAVAIRASSAGDAGRAAAVCRRHANADSAATAAVIRRSHNHRDRQRRRHPTRPAGRGRRPQRCARPLADRLAMVGPSPAAFLQLLHCDPALCAATMRLVQQHAPHSLHALAGKNESLPQSQPQPMAAAAVHDPTALSAAVALITGDSSAQSPPVQVESEEAKLIRIGRLRDRALVTDTIAIVLSFLPARERPLLSRIGREWRSAVQQPKLWANAGWRFCHWLMPCAFSASADHCHECAPSPVSSWLRCRIGRVKCSTPQLLHVTPLAALSSFTAVKHLDIVRGNCKHVPSTSAEDIRRALQPLRLLSFGVESFNTAIDLLLLEALLGPVGVSGSGEAGSAPSPASAPLLCLWAPTLTELSVCCSDGFGNQPDTGSLMDSVSRLHWPALRSLSLTIPSFAMPNSTSIVALPRLLMRERTSRLQTLKIATFGVGFAAIESFLATLPLISSSLTELDLQFKLRLTETQSDDWLPGFHLLPSLRVLRCDIHEECLMASAIARSIALAPKLEVLQLYSSYGASEVCEQLGSRCEATSENGSGGVGRDIGGDLGPDRIMIMLRELHLSDCHLRDDELSALALLPQLEHLKCRISVDSVGMLGGLRHLRSLRLSFEGECDDIALQQLSRLQLPQLKSLIIPYLVDSSGIVTIRNGVCHLLEIPSLTRLELPWLSKDQADHLRLIHCASDPVGRRGPFIDATTVLTSRWAGLFDA